MAGLKLACMLLVCMVVVATPIQAAVSCSQVSSNLVPCVSYLQNGGTIPPSCCSGIKSLNSAAKTTPDRQTACRCMKSAASAISGLNLNLAAGLPSKCGVSIPYKISPSIDCNSVK